MPDRDIFNRNVEQGWQAAARHLYLGDDDIVTLKSLMRALGIFVKNGGCPGIDQISDVLVSALSSPDLSACRRETVGQLEQLRRKWGGSRTHMAVDIARSILSNPLPETVMMAKSGEVERARIEIAKAILCGLATMKTSPVGRFLQALVEEEGVSVEMVLDREAYGCHLLKSSLKLTNLACQVLDQTSGELVKVPRIQMPKRPQEEIVYMPISF